MNFIICGEPCKHQREGYCALEGTAVITNTTLSSCRYFQPLDTAITDNGEGDYHAYKNRTPLQDI